MGLTRYRLLTDGKFLYVQHRKSWCPWWRHIKQPLARPKQPQAYRDEAHIEDWIAEELRIANRRLAKENKR